VLEEAGAPGAIADVDLADRQIGHLDCDLVFGGAAAAGTLQGG
jgi:hypothetical protein